VSRHNYKHWKHIPYLGFGPSAHSFWNNQRWANVLSVKKYITQLSEKKKPLQFKEKLATKDLLFEHIFLNLRTYSGINLQNFKKDFSLNFVNKFEKIVEPLLKLNYAILDDNYFKLTHKGMILCDEILPSFVES
jgi:oxygen-independent coproporphyrinogen-3 oxidase